MDHYCPYCGSSRFKKLGPGKLLRQDVPRERRTDIGDDDEIVQCIDPECEGVFGANSLGGTYKIVARKKKQILHLHFSF